MTSPSHFNLLNWTVHPAPHSTILKCVKCLQAHHEPLTLCSFDGQPSICWSHFKPVTPQIFSVFMAICKVKESTISPKNSKTPKLPNYLVLTWAKKQQEMCKSLLLTEQRKKISLLSTLTCVETSFTYFLAIERRKVKNIAFISHKWPNAPNQLRCKTPVIQGKA